MTVGNTTYVISHVPSSSIPISSNAIPPPHSRGPLGWNFAMSHVHAAATCVVVSQSQVPPVVLGDCIPTSGGHILTSGTVIADFITLGESHFVWPSPIPLQTL